METAHLLYFTIRLICKLTMLLQVFSSFIHYLISLPSHACNRQKILAKYVSCDKQLREPGEGGKVEWTAALTACGVWLVPHTAGTHTLHKLKTFIIMITRHYTQSYFHKEIGAEKIMAQKYC